MYGLAVNLSVPTQMDLKNINKNIGHSGLKLRIFFGNCMKIQDLFWTLYLCGYKMLEIGMCDSFFENIGKKYPNITRKGKIRESFWM